MTLPPERSPSRVPRPGLAIGADGHKRAKPPIVVLGGFLAPAPAYAEMSLRLHALTGRPVSIVPTVGFDWIPSIVPAGWSIVLRKLDETVRQAVDAFDTGCATLVCHSAGGLIARLYVSSQPVNGRVYSGMDRVERIITLGTPHSNQCRRVHGGMLADYVNTHVPGAYSAPTVKYVAVAGRFVRGDQRGCLRERHAYDFYRKLGGDGGSWGDGLVPVGSALLQGADQVILDGVSHHRIYGSPWYGSRGTVACWWNQAHGSAGERLTP